MSPMSSSVTAPALEAYPVGACFSDEDIAFIQSQIPAILRGQLSTARWTERFEQSVAAAAGTRYAVAFPSCTAALESALVALGIRPGDEVLIPAQTFVATAMAVHLVGARPVVCDILPATHCLAPEEIARRASPRTKGVILVHLAGLITPDLPQIQDQCDKLGLWLLEDCAHAHGASAQGRVAGSIGRAGCFSYYPTKVLTSGEGGALTTDDPRIAEVARSLQNRGRDMSAPTELYIRAGHNYRFPEISALLGCVQHTHLAEFLRLRDGIARYYRARLREAAPSLEVQVHPTGVVHSYWKFLVNLPRHMSRERIQSFMALRGAAIHWSYWPPVHLMPVMRELFGYSPGECPVAEDVLSRNISLPIDPRLDQRQMEHVIDTLLEAVREEDQ